MMPAPPPEKRTLLFVMLAAVSVALLAVLWPFRGTLLWSVILALLFAPLYRRLLPHVGDRRTPAALLTVLVIVLIVIVPLSVLTASLADEISTVVERLQSGEWQPVELLRQLLALLPTWLVEQLQRLGLTDISSLQRRLVTALGAGSELIARQALRVGQNTLEFAISLVIMLYITFFLLRDGDELARSLRRGLPLSTPHQQELSEKFSTVVRATVKGNVLIALIQGSLGGLAFWVLGVQAVLLWTVLMAFLSLLPTVGAALVWLPVALVFLATGAVWKGLALVIWGALVIGLVDNLLRPILVGKDTRLPDYVVLITTLGGLSAFGLHGFVLGPMIAAMFFAVWHITVMPRPRLPTPEPAPIEHRSDPA